MHIFFTEGILLVCSSGLKAVEIVMICENHLLGEPCSIAWRTCWLSYTVLNGSFLARANILQAEVFLFSPLMLSVSSWSNEPMVEVMLANLKQCEF